MGGFRLPVRYGARFDAKIAKALKSGQTCKIIAETIGTSAVFVQNRAHKMGLSQQVYANGARARSLANSTRTNRWRAKATPAEAIVRRERKIITKADPEVSRIAHRVRAARAPLSRHAIAALHERGLTLDDLHFATGRPVEALADLIRQGAR